MRLLRHRLPWLLAALLALSFLMPALRPVFAWLFPALERPVYTQQGFPALLWAHLWLTAAASLAAAGLGLGLGVAVTRRGGAEFRPLVEMLAAGGQNFPPVAVLALAVPALGFGAAPALLALFLYGLLPVVQNAIAGLQAVPAAVLEAARGQGMSGARILRDVELPLAAPVILAGIRTSTTIGLGTAAIAATVGATSLGAPIIVGLNGGNTAYVLQGALVLGLLALCVDAAFDLLARAVARWRVA